MKSTPAGSRVSQQASVSVGIWIAAAREMREEAGDPINDEPEGHYEERDGGGCLAAEPGIWREEPNA